MTKPWPLRLLSAGSEWPSDLVQAAQDELVQLWGDLNAAVRDAHGGCWSVGCENLAYRIVALTRLVGAVDWTKVDTRLVQSNVYSRIHAEAGLAHPPIDWDAVAEHLRWLREAST